MVIHRERAREEERKALVREVHDALGQNLLVLRMDITRLRAWALEHDARIHEEANLMLENLDSSLHSIKSIIKNFGLFSSNSGSMRQSSGN